VPTLAGGGTEQPSPRTSPSRGAQGWNQVGRGGRLAGTKRGGLGRTAITMGPPATPPPLQRPRGSVSQGEPQIDAIGSPVPRVTPLSQHVNSVTPPSANGPPRRDQQPATPSPQRRRHETPSPARAEKAAAVMLPPATPPPRQAGDSSAPPCQWTPVSQRRLLYSPVQSPVGGRQDKRTLQTSPSNCESPRQRPRVQPPSSDRSPRASTEPRSSSVGRTPSGGSIFINPWTDV